MMTLAEMHSESIGFVILGQKAPYDTTFQEILDTLKNEIKKPALSHFNLFYVFIRCLASHSDFAHMSFVV